MMFSDDKTELHAAAITIMHLHKHKCFGNVLTALGLQCPKARR
jgi:hypothetical protein